MLSNVGFFFSTWAVLCSSLLLAAMPIKAGKKRPVPAGAEEPVKKGKSIACRVTQKINEHFRTLSPEEVDVIMDDATQQTLRERLHADLAEKDSGLQGIKNTHTQTF